MSQTEQTGRSGLIERLAFDQLGAEARALYFHLATAGTNPTMPWEETPGALREKWENVVEIIGLQCEREADCSWKGLASKCFEGYHGGQLQYEELDQPQQLFWEAVVRHLVNIVSADEEQDKQLLFGKYEFWVKWLIERLNNGT